MWHRPLGPVRPILKPEGERCYVRMTGKSPYNIRYGDIEYRVSPVELADVNASYIAAQMINLNGRLHRPVYEHELSGHFPGLTGAREAWGKGFESSSEFFLCRAIVEKLIAEGMAETVSPESISPLAVPNGSLTLGRVRNAADGGAEKLLKQGAGSPEAG